MFVHRSLGSRERKQRGENIILRGNILAVVANKLQKEGHQGGGRVTEVILGGIWPFLFSITSPPSISWTGNPSKLLALNPRPWEQNRDSHKQAAGQPAATFVPAVALKSTAGNCLGNLFPFCYYHYYYLFFPRTVAFFFFLEAHFFKPKFAQPFWESHCISSRQPQGVSSYMEWVPYRNPGSLRRPRAMPALMGHSSRVRHPDMPHFAPNLQPAFQALPQTPITLEQDLGILVSALSQKQIMWVRRDP